MNAPIFVHGSTTTPWWAMLLIIFMPGISAVALTIISMVVWKRMWRADGNLPPKVSMVVKRTLIIGMFWGAIMQFCLQRLVAAMTGLLVYPELILAGAVVTGPASMAGYEALCWWFKRKGWMDAYAFMRVKHDSSKGHTGDTPNGDFTVYGDVPAVPEEKTVLLTKEEREAITGPKP